MTTPAAPDLSVLAGYVRNRIKAGEIACFHAKGREVIVARVPGDRLLIATDSRGSILLGPEDRINIYTFQRGGFSLQLAAFLVILLNGIRAKSEKP